MLLERAQTMTLFLRGNLHDMKRSLRVYVRMCGCDLSKYLIDTKGLLAT